MPHSRPLGARIWVLGCRLVLATVTAGVGAWGLRADDASPDSGLRAIEVRVTNEQGEPLAEASVRTSVWLPKGRRGPPNREYVTNQQGVATIEVPRRLRILRVWTRTPHHVPAFWGFEEDRHDEGRGIPDRLDFRLAAGTRLSGTVVDENGAPVAGVRVEVMLLLKSAAQDEAPRQSVDAWLADGDSLGVVPITDAEGHWELDNAPRQEGDQDHHFQLRLTHDDHVWEPRFGELQRRQGLASSALRDGSAKLVLQRGARIRGSVVGPNGEPVERGLVIWSDRRFRRAGEQETRIEAGGHFETATLPLGEHELTIVAPGYAPQRWRASADPIGADTRIVLARGERLELRLRTPAGPEADAHVRIRWRGCESLNTTELPNRPDSSGVYVWEWAPDDAATYDIEAPGCLATTVTLTPGLHDIELRASLNFSGKVTDALTGRPIPEFRVIPVYHREHDRAIAFYPQASRGANGQFEIVKDEPADFRTKYSLRFEAAGYRSFHLATTYAADAGPVALDVALSPAPPRTGRVVDPSGRPVVGAEILVATPMIEPEIINGETEWSERLTTDGEGRFSIAATDEVVRIRALHATGFAEIRREPDEPLGELGLAPWASISGRVVQDGRPLAGERVGFHPRCPVPLSEPQFADYFQTTTDAEGRFEFSRVTVTHGALRSMVDPWTDSQLTSGESIPWTTRPGVRLEVELGGGGAAVVGRVVPTGRADAPLDLKWSLGYLVSRAPVTSPCEGPTPRDAEPADWSHVPLMDGRFASWVRERPHHEVKLASDGTLRIGGVAAGSYDLLLNLFENTAGGCLVYPVGRLTIPVEIQPDDVAKGTKSLGTLEVPCRVGPSVGADMQGLQVFDSSGKAMSLRDAQGKWVVLHFWASWCAPCLETLPLIGAEVERRKSAPVLFAGVNVDAEPAEARELAKRSGWIWGHEYAGEQSAIAQRLAVSGLPTYYLIGPDSRLVATSSHWNDIRERLDKALSEKSSKPK